MNKRYNELLKDGRWQMKRIKILERDHFRCVRCGKSAEEGTQLHVHHKFYDGRAPWEYEDKDLITLCEDCHNRIHGKSDDIKPGDLMQYEHSDATNTGFVIYANKEKDLVCTLTYDDLSGTDDIWLEYWKWDIFLKETEKVSPEDVLGDELFEVWLVNVYLRARWTPIHWDLTTACAVGRNGKGGRFLHDAARVIARSQALIEFRKRISLSGRKKALLDKGGRALYVYTVVHDR